MKSITEIRHELAGKAADNEAFRRSLMADPKAVIGAEYSIQVPDGVTINVHEDSATVAHLILSPNPQLTQTDLEQVAGGSETNDYAHGIAAALIGGDPKEEVPD